MIFSVGLRIGAILLLYSIFLGFMFLALGFDDFFLSFLAFFSFSASSDSLIDWEENSEKLSKGLAVYLF